MALLWLRAVATSRVLSIWSGRRPGPLPRALRQPNVGRGYILTEAATGPRRTADGGCGGGGGGCQRGRLQRDWWPPRAK